MSSSSDFWQATDGDSPQKPLSGRTVLNTRPQVPEFGPNGSTPDRLTQRLELAGAQVIHHPVIEVAALDEFSRLDAAISRLSEYAWLVAVSVNGVRFWHHRMQQLNVEDKALPQIGAIGIATAKAFQSVGQSLALTPKVSNSAGMADLIIEKFSGASAPGLILRASRGSDGLPERLQAAGVPFEQVAVYQNRDVVEADPKTIELLQAGRIDWLTLTSSATAISVVNLFGEHLGDVKLATISPTTSAVVRELGLSVAAEAEVYNLDGVCDAIIENR